ncbi:MAG: hypothetical protein HQL03_11650 [Nitrospirae bacterium]|nr:hypothetical protein [Nitrospirota bacterium]MBF0590663.1 hypothetical protein [Nitrospirota bacterium]
MNCKTTHNTYDALINKWNNSMGANLEGKITRVVNDKQTEIAKSLEPANTPEQTPIVHETSGEILALVEECVGILDYAIDALENEDDIINSEIQMSMLLATAFGFEKIKIDNENLYTLISMLQIGLFVHRDRAYSLKEIKTIHEVFKIIKDNLDMNADIHEKCEDILYEIGIDPSVIFYYMDDKE